MKNSEKIDVLLKERIEKLAAEISDQRRRAMLFSSLAAIPLITLGVVAVMRFDETTGAAIPFLSAISGVGLTIIIWSIGGSSRERAVRAEGDRERTENLRLCLLAVPDEEIKASELLAMISRRENPFEVLKHSSSLSKFSDDEVQRS